MAEPVERPRLPVWVSVVALGLAAVFVWWLVSAVVRSLGWLLRTALVVVVVGGILYLVLVVTGRAKRSGGS